MCTGVHGRPQPRAAAGGRRGLAWRSPAAPPGRDGASPRRRTRWPPGTSRAPRRARARPAARRPRRRGSAAARRRPRVRYQPSPATASTRSSSSSSIARRVTRSRSGSAASSSRMTARSSCRRTPTSRARSAARPTAPRGGGEQRGERVRLRLRRPPRRLDGQRADAADRAGQQVGGEHGGRVVLRAAHVAVRPPVGGDRDRDGAARAGASARSARRPRLRGAQHRLGALGLRRGDGPLPFQRPRQHLARVGADEPREPERQVGEVDQSGRSSAAPPGPGRPAGSRSATWPARRTARAR